MCRVIRRAARRRWWWKLWFRTTILFKRHVLLRKHVMDASVLTKKTPRNTADTVRLLHAASPCLQHGPCSYWLPVLNRAALKRRCVKLRRVLGF